MKNWGVILIHEELYPRQMRTSMMKEQQSAYLQILHILVEIV